MIYSINEIQAKVQTVAEQYNYDIEEIRLFGSYFNGNPTEQSDVDLAVKYGRDCNGLNRIAFMNDIEKELGKVVDVINVYFPPDFMLSLEYLNPQQWYQVLYRKD